MMHLKIMLPGGILLDEPVKKVTAEAENGEFCLLPRHVDTVIGLVPGLLSFVPKAGDDERYVAVDIGVLVKCGDAVRVSVRQAVAGEDLGSLQRAVRERFEHLDETERRVRTALSRLEADFIQQFIGMQSHGPH